MDTANDQTTQSRKTKEDPYAERNALAAPYTPWPVPARRRRKVVNDKGQEAQHHLLSAASVTLTAYMLARLSEDESYEKYKAIRFVATGGRPVCIHKECNHDKVYEITTRRIFKCAACRRQFSVTSGTAFASRKLTFNQILVAVLVFANGVNGVAALRLRREIGLSYKTSFVLGHKLRQAMMKSRDPRKLRGEVEVDGIAFPHSQRSARIKKDTKRINARPYQQTVIAVRERGKGGESRLTVRLGEESQGLDFLMEIIEPGSKINTDNGPWGDLAVVGPLRTVNHSEGYVIDGVSSNLIESLFARLRRLQRGTYFRIIGKNLDLYAQEASWREDYRHEHNGAQFTRLLMAMTQTPVSARWKGYWQRWQDPETPRRRRGRKITWEVEYGFNPVADFHDGKATIEGVAHQIELQDQPPRTS